MPLAGPLELTREELRIQFFHRIHYWVERNDAGEVVHEFPVDPRGYTEAALKQVRTETDDEYEARVAPLLDAIEAKQSKRIPTWKPGDKLAVYWHDIQESTGAIAYVGDF